MFPWDLLEFLTGMNFPAFSFLLMNGSRKLECYTKLSCNGLLGINDLVCWAHSKFKKKMKF
jgi:hypothetical protein